MGSRDVLPLLAAFCLSTGMFNRSLAGASAPPEVGASRRRLIYADASHLLRMQQPSTKLNIGIAGAGPAGLAISIAPATLGRRVEVFEKHPRIPDVPWLMKRSLAAHVVSNPVAVKSHASALPCAEPRGPAPSREFFDGSER